MREYFIAGNWKMFKTPSEGAKYAAELVKTLKDIKVKVMIAPNFASLDAVGKAIKGSAILLGAQNMASAEDGAHTGEVSPLMLKDLGVDVVILGHSERRSLYGETDDLINEKVKLALKHGFEVILCVGETLEEREAGRVEDVVNRQLLQGLTEVSATQIDKIVIAYEPVWAIGTGKTATPEDADAVHKVIRKTLSENYNKEVADRIVIQYGGSVKPGNVKELMGMPNIDGALVGGASLKIEDFTAIVKFDT
jgi:triosephosphate isomerase